RRLGTDTWRGYADSLPDDQRSAVRFYTGNGYEDVNEPLREGVAAAAGIDATIALLDAVMAAAPTVPEAVVVGRSVTESIFGLPRRGDGPVTPQSNTQRLADALALRGRPFRDDGFMSTAMQTDGFHHDRHEARLQIEVPAGTRALYVSSHPDIDGAPDPRSLAEYGPDENELLIGRGVEFEITDAQIDDVTGDLLFRVRVTGQSPARLEEGR
ncbi:MAG: ADP-ribosyltransferase, partial [Rhodococcus sp. (in: high G+C Gram-positive bacteria)]